ncbi:PREDICTED: fetuin-B-like [Crocodylus porosus]|uniref:fetuin-B-like n=1 Tax=Crocodylus porosus TaxID=8502 RepID=UPI000939BFC8|nr:PREDICTED: fetuin-B-like [Crocodylus porosus]XP_019388345.1 PREDICTED: fetuin-B-like [Crocodylus porosus]
MKLILLLAYVWMVDGGTPLLPLYPVPCNARIAEKTARLAISYINEDRTEGYKLSLNRINRVFGSHQGAAGKVYYMDLDVLETKCYIRSALPWEDCDIRPFVETKVSGTCRAIVHIKPDVSAITCGYNCSLAPDAEEKITSICPECLTFITPDSWESMKAVNLTLNKVNEESNESHYFAATKVIRALSSTLTQPGQDFHVEFTIKETDCIRGRDSIGRSCTFKSPETARTGFCVGDVYIKDGADVEASCELYEPKGPSDAPQGNASGGSLDAKPDPTCAPGKPEQTTQTQKPTGDHRLNIKPRHHPVFGRRESSSESESSEERGKTFVHTTVSRKHPQHTDPALQPSPRPMSNSNKPPAAFLESFPELPPHQPTCPGRAIHITL